MAEAQPTFRRGREHIERAASRSGDYEKADFISWEAEETKVLRFLHDTDHVITLWTHEFIKGADNKPRSFICRRDLFSEDCEICDTFDDPRSRELGYGRAVLRLPVTDESGTVTGYSDAVKSVEDKKNKEKKDVPMIGIVQRGQKNFWKRLIAAEKKSGPLYTFDCDILREGTELDTQYHPFPNPVMDISNLFPDMKCPDCGFEVVGQEGIGKGFRGAKCPNPTHGDEAPELEGTPGRYDKYVPNLEDMLARQGSLQYYDRFLHGKSVKEDGKGEVASANGQEKPDLEPSELDRIRAERARVEQQGYE